MEEMTFISAGEILTSVSYLAPGLEVRGGSYVEAGGGCPDAVASGADDGGLVEVAGGNQAGDGQPYPRSFLYITCGRTLCRCKLLSRG